MKMTRRTITTKRIIEDKSSDQRPTRDGGHSLLLVLPHSVKEVDILFALIAICSKDPPWLQKSLGENVKPPAFYILYLVFRTMMYLYYVMATICSF